MNRIKDYLNSVAGNTPVRLMTEDDGVITIIKSDCSTLFQRKGSLLEAERKEIHLSISDGYLVVVYK